MSVLEQIKAALKEELAQAAVRAGVVQPDQLPDIALETPREKEHGDLATNLAMQLTRIAKRNPREIAEAIVGALDKEKAGVASVAVAGPGFINFIMKKDPLYRVILETHRQDADYGRVDLGRGRKINVEFVSANPTGSLHLGHARGAAVGDALCNVLAFAGYDVTREYYINDAGNQIANLAASIEARYKQALGLEADMPEDGYYGEDIVGFAAELAEREGDRLLHLPEEERRAYFRAYGLERELAKIRRDLERFRVKFDIWFSETSLYETGKTEQALQELRARGAVYEQDGAVWLRTTDYGDDKDRVLIKNDGTYTYLTPDIAYHKEKYARGYDQLINIWGADHHGYIPRIKAAMALLGNDPDRLTVLIAQMVSLYQNGEKVRMSKRTGKAVTMEELMDEVGVDAIRYFFTMRGVDSHLDFDMDLAISQSNDNPVYYVQYAHARVCSVFRQAAEQGIAMRELDRIDFSQLNREAEYELLKKLAEFPQEIAAAAQQYAPHRVIRYVYELATMFHSYYKAERVLTDDAELTQARLALFSAVRIVVRNALRLVGVEAPERM
jgi:arginyl-tRNA synthetase